MRYINKLKFVHNRNPLSLLFLMVITMFFSFNYLEDNKFFNEDKEVFKAVSMVKDSIYVTEDTSSKKTVESSQLRIWMRSTARYGIQLKSSGSTIFYGTDSAYLNIVRGSSSFPNGLNYNHIGNMTLKSFVINGTTIEQTRTDGVFDYIFRLSIVNATSQGAYMKAEIEMKNLTSSSQLVGASFNIDTMVNGNDRSPFRIVNNGWEAFNGGVQATAYYQDVFNTTQADSIYLGQYYNQYPMPVNTFYIGQEIYPGDSGAGFYYNPEYVGAYQSRKESWIIGMGPRNANPTFGMTSPSDNQTYYRGQSFAIQGTARDTDIGDILQVKWSVDGGTENTLTSFVANGSNQPFSYNYTLPSNLSEGWHTLQVWVMDDKGGVSSSNSRSFYVNNFIAPDTPYFGSVTNNSFYLYFDKKANVSSTTYELNKVHNGVNADLGTSSSLYESGLTPNTLYQYRVRAKNTSGVYTGYSGIGSIYTLANAPTSVSIDSSVAGQALLTWGANGNPAGTTYHYEIRNASNSTVVKSGSVSNGTSSLVTSIPTNVGYNVYVKAINGNNISTSFTYLGYIYQDTILPEISLSPNGNESYRNNHSAVLNVSDYSGINSTSYVWSQSNVFPGLGSSWQSASNGLTINSPANVSGDWYLHIKSTDNAGNTRNLTSSRFRLDNQIPTKGSLNVTKPNGGHLKLDVTGASDSHSGLDANTAYYYTIKDSSNIVINSGWTKNSYDFTSLKGNETYEITYKVRDNIGNLEESGSSIIVRTKSYNILSVTKKDITPESLTFKINENVLNMYGETALGSKYKLSLKDSSNSVVSTRNYSVILDNIKYESLHVNKPYTVYGEVENSEGDKTAGEVNLGTYYTASKIPAVSINSITTSSHLMDIVVNGNPIGTQYYVERALNNTFTNGLTVVNNWTTNLTINSSNLSSGTDYYYRIKSRNGDNIESGWSIVYHYKTVTAKPDNINVVVGSYDATTTKANMIITWSEVVGADKYYIYRDNIKIAEVPKGTLTFTDNLNEFNKSFEYEISALSDLGNSKGIELKESEKSNKVKRVTRPRNMTGVELTNMEASTAYFNIKTSNLNVFEPEYYIEIRPKGTTTVEKTSAYSNVVTNRKIEGLRYGVAYEVWMKARNSENTENPLVKLIDEFWMNRAPEIDLQLADVYSGLVNANEYANYSDVPGYTFIQVRGKLMDKDILPVGDPLEIRYTIKDSNGNPVSGHSNKLIDNIIATGTWQDIKNSAGAPLNIPITSVFAEGKYIIEVTVKDDQNEVSKGTANFLVDRTAPKGKIINESPDNPFGVNLKVDGVDGNIAGLDSKPYALEVKVNGGKFNRVNNYNSSSKYAITYNKETESNTKYTYRALIKDKAGNVLTTDVYEYISGINLVEKEIYYNKEIPSTIEIDWTNELKAADGLSIEIYRNGSLTSTVTEGKNFIDTELDYEREYTYEFIVVGKDINGNRLESSKKTVVYKTGKPVLIVYAPFKELNKTLFSDVVNGSMQVEYKPGGSLAVDYTDKRESVVESFELLPNLRNKIDFTFRTTKGMVIPMKFKLKNNNLIDEVKFSIKINEVTPTIRDLTPEKYVEINK